MWITLEAIAYDGDAIYQVGLVVNGTIGKVRLYCQDIWECKEWAEIKLILECLQKELPILIGVWNQK